MSPGCLLFFGLPFFLTGLGMAGYVATRLWLAWSASAWVEVPATLTRVEIEQGETEKVLAEYRYKFAGRAYTGDRVGFWFGSDNVGSYQSDTYKRLKAAWKAEQTVPCYVDPDDPRRALLDRDLRPAMLVVSVPFMVAFPLGGLWIMALGWRYRQADRRRGELASLHPGKPWLWRDEWLSGEIVSSNRAKVLAHGFGAVMWNAISFPIAGFFLMGEREHPPWVYIFVLFSIIGIGLIGYAFYEFLRWRRSGESRLRLATQTGVIGGRLAGVIVATDQLRAAETVKLSLACTQTTKSGDDQKTEILWSDERVVDRLLDADGPGRVGVPVAFSIPWGVEASGIEDGVAWELTANAKLPGPDFRADFEVPVFITDESSHADTAVEPGPLTDYERDVPLADLLRQEKIRFIESPAGVRCVSPAARSPVGCVALVVAAMGVTAGLAAAFWYGHWFTAYFCLVVSVLLWAGAGQACLAASELTLTDKVWRAKCGWLGFRGSGSEFVAPQIRAIKSKAGLRAHAHTDLMPWNHVVAELSDGRSVTLVRSIASRACERKLIAELRRLAGLGR